MLSILVSLTISSGNQSVYYLKKTLAYLSRKTCLTIFNFYHTLLFVVLDLVWDYLNPHNLPLQHIPPLKWDETRFPEFSYSRFSGLFHSPLKIWSPHERVPWAKGVRLLVVLLQPVECPKLGQHVAPNPLCLFSIPIDGARLKTISFVAATLSLDLLTTNHYREQSKFVKLLIGELSQTHFHSSITELFIKIE